MPGLVSWFCSTRILHTLGYVVLETDATSAVVMSSRQCQRKSVWDFVSTILFSRLRSLKSCVRVRCPHLGIEVAGSSIMVDIRWLHNTVTSLVRLLLCRLWDDSKLKYYS